MHEENKMSMANNRPEVMDKIQEEGNNEDDFADF